jgi:hypothetical protein
VLPWGVRGYNDILSVGASMRREFQQAAKARPTRQGDSSEFKHR